ncbi:hypothetical protein HaLaN_00398 [Haematococcus lacustris]|uniref:Uncharacterized protein n=1 Tax=Haematococcus lacustris TaxID=44745 RepID=A0A699Y958_HAELA|nr:hypothetical protein HaLaN_00398 [Haematococcus lacustris]
MSRQLARSAAARPAAERLDTETLRIPQPATRKGSHALMEEGVTSLKKFKNGVLPDLAKSAKYIEGTKDM